MMTPHETNSSRICSFTLKSPETEQERMELRRHCLSPRLATVHGVAESRTWLSDFTYTILSNSSSSIEAIRTFNFRKCCFSPERRQMWKKHSDVTFQLIMNSYTSVFLFFLLWEKKKFNLEPRCWNFDCVIQLDLR